MLPPLATERLLDLLRQMLRIRRAGEHTVRFLEDGLVHGAIHPSIGQEAAAVGACAALDPEDYVFSTSRNQGQALARGMPVAKLLAEGLAREGGYSGGHGGWVHTADPALGLLHTSGAVGNGVGLAVGAAWGLQVLGSRRATIAFFSEGVMEGGLFYEVLNIACIWRVPIVLVLEDNSVPKGEPARAGACHAAHAARSFAEVVAPFQVPGSTVDGNDVGAVHAAVLAAKTQAAERQGPAFVEAKTSRWHGVSPSPDQGQTRIVAAWDPTVAPAPLRAWIDGDPVLRYARELVEAGAATREQVEALDAVVAAEVDEAARFARESPLPPGEGALDDVFAPR